MMIINQDLVAQVRHAWISEQQHPQRGRRKAPIPDSEQLGTLLDIVFRTSMIPEAGSHVRASVAWLSIADFREHEMKHARQSELVLKLQRNRLLDSAVLAELGKATESGSCSLLVDWFDDDDPMIWGMIYYLPGARTLHEIPGTIEQGIHGAPDCPILSIDGIGSISINRGDALVGRITRGEFSRAVPAPRAFYSHPMGMILFDLFGLRMALKGGGYADDGDNAYARSLLECLKYLLEELDRQAGEALVVFVPQASMEDALAHADLPWASTGSLELGHLLRTRIRHQKEARENQWMSMSHVTKAEALIRARLDAFARMASIDSALLLSPDFDLIGFGAKLRAPSWNGTVTEGLDGFGGGGSAFDFSRLGTRHTSAVAYVGAAPGSVAFVASADGPIRAMARKGHGPIHCWPDCRLSMLAS
jgi:hypothetical protein